MSGFRVAKTRLLSVVRRGPGEVVWTPEFMGLGNLLYIALWVARDRSNRSMLRTPALVRWLSVFPALEQLSVSREAVGFTDVRRSAITQSYGSFGTDFSEGELKDFITTYLLPSHRPTVSGRLAMNIRRGDYFADPSVRGYFGFDLDAYLRVAIGGMRDQEPLGRVLIVSDGLDWCRARLGWVGEMADVEYASVTSPADDFWRVATSRRILMTNTTFSYWAGYVHDVLQPDAASHVWAPAFFSRWQPDHRSWGLDPRWSVIEDIPGGWDS